MADFLRLDDVDRKILACLVEDGRSTCEYDIKAVFSDGGTAEFRNQNLCETTTFSVHD